MIMMKSVRIFFVRKTEQVPPSHPTNDRIIAFIMTRKFAAHRAPGPKKVENVLSLELVDMSGRIIQEFKI